MTHIINYRNHASEIESVVYNASMGDTRDRNETPPSPAPTKGDERIRDMTLDVLERAFTIKFIAIFVRTGCQCQYFTQINVGDSC